jgi:outer membrane receptor protein involved in Fe transport
MDGAQETLSSHNDETDLDQTLVGTVTSVLSDTKVNTIRVGGVLEETVHANPAWRALKPEYARCVPCPEDAGLDQVNTAPVLDYDSFDLQAHATMDYSLQYSWSIDDTFSWFIPDAKGRHDMKFGARFTTTKLDNPNWSNMNGTYRFDHDLPYDAANPSTYPNRFSIRVPGPLSYDLRMDVLELYAQDKWQIRPNLTLSAGVRYDLERMPYTTDAGNPLFSDPTKYPVDTDNVAPRLGLIWNPDGQGRSAVRFGYGLFYDRHGGQFPHRYEIRAVVHGGLPAEHDRSGSGKRPIPDRSHAHERTRGPDHTGGAGLCELDLPARKRLAQHRHDLLG